MVYHIVNRRESSRTGGPIWMKFECGAGSRWTSTTEDYSGYVCNFSGCNCGTRVKLVGDTDNVHEEWFGLRVGQPERKTLCQCK
jgi:hypothetical protein